MKAAILLGAPGAGKGTAAEGIKSATSYVHVSTGDMLREAVKQGTPVGREAEAYMKRGELVPDAIIIGIVEERIDAGGSSACYLFDGFPRTLAQAELLDAALARHGGRLNFVFNLTSPRELLISRLTGRRICRNCGANYHVVNIPPKVSGRCDACGGELYQRPDDREETIVNRLDVFEKQTESLIAYYRAKGVLVDIDSAQPRQETIGRIVKLLNAPS